MLAALVFLSGCWDAADINNKDIATCVAVDKEDDEYYFYAEIPDITGTKKTSGGDQGSESDELSTVFGKGTTFVDARENLNNKLDKTYFLGAIRTFVLTDDLLKDGINTYFYRLQSISDFRKAIKVVSTFETVNDLFRVDPENNTSVGYALEETNETLRNKGIALTITSSDVLEFLYSPNPCFIIPNFDIRDGNLALTGYSVIYDGYFRGFIEFEETNGVLWMLSSNTKITYIVPYGDGGEAAVEAQFKKRQIEPMLEGDKISFKVVLETKSSIKYLNQKNKLSESEIKEVKENLQSQILDDLAFSIGQAGQEFGCEYLGFDDSFRIAYPNEYKELDWSDAFMNSDIEVSVSTDLNPSNVIKTEKD